MVDIRDLVSPAPRRGHRWASLVCGPEKVLKLQVPWPEQPKRAALQSAPRRIEPCRVWGRFSEFIIELLHDVQNITWQAQGIKEVSDSRSGLKGWSRPFHVVRNCECRGSHR